LFFLFEFKYKKRIFDSSKEIRKLFLFASSLELVSEMIHNINVRYHASHMIQKLNEIVLLLTQSLISEEEKEKLFELGKHHYHFGIKKEYFKVFLVYKII
jgi:hypothetical protein